MQAAEAPIHLPNLDTTLGAAFLGNTFAIALYGVTTLQTIVYIRNSHRDWLPFRLLIVFLWILDTLHSAFTTHGLYFYLITNYANPIAIASPTWTLLAQVYITCISDFIVRSVFTRRIWVLSGRRYFLPMVIMLITCFVFATGVGFATRGFQDITFARLTAHSEWMLYSALGAGVVADVLIAGSLCILLYKNHTGFQRADSLVNILIIYSINTGLLTTICAAGCFITFAIWPYEFIFMGIYFSLGKLYLNSLLGLLNSREALRDQLVGTNASLRHTSNNHVQMSIMVATTSESTIAPGSPNGKDTFA
ncbi:hypothetical protein AX16_007512 [Volvariella volvacea WC 439]|nr:hypothetical protein AX16_007512 [Volvariella volvacea WC 439]